MKTRILAWLAVLLFPASATAAEIRVAAAASLAESVTEICQEFQKAEKGDTATPVFAGSNVLARQIEEGAPIDVFISADEATMQKVVAGGHIAQETVQPLLTNSLVVVTAADSTLSIAGAADLAALKRIALGDPAAVPAGVYAKAWLTRQGKWEALSAKVLAAENVRAALAAVEAGNVDAAIVYRTDAAISKKVRIAFSVPTAEAPAIVYPVAVCRDSKQPATAARFVAFLKGDKATAIFKSRGFGLPAAAAAAEKAKTPAKP